MAAIESKHITLPTEVAEEIVTKARDTSVIQTLSPSTPQIFKNVEHMVFTKEPEAEFVAEGGQKSSMDVKFTPVPGEIHKAQTTVRMDAEVQWADEDNRLQIVDSIVEAGSAALGHALDYGVFHAVNPATGAAIESMTALTAGANAVTAPSDPSVDVGSLRDAVNEEYDVSGIALSKKFANDLRKVRVKNTMARLYPEIPINLKTGSLEGINAATSSTVSGKLATTATNVLAILGDFSLIKWGVVRDLGLDVITMGDPDGLGDLKRLNQVAYRLEVVYSWAVLDPKGFAVLKSAAA